MLKPFSVRSCVQFLLVCIASATLHAERLAAQSTSALTRTISGSVIDSAGKPVAGALVATRSAKGELLAQSVTGADGAFSMPLAPDAHVDVYALLVGFEPSAPVPVPATPTNLQLTLVASSVRALVTNERSRQREVCGAPRDTTLDVTRLWQEARKALASTGLRYGTRSITARIALFDRTTSRDGKTVLTERLHETEVSSQRPFQSLPADSVARGGYVVETEDDVAYYAPDADGLLSGSFAEQHCFVVSSSPSREGWIGLAFKPRGERPGVKDIDGTLWFDRSTLELRRVEFRYTNVPPSFRTARIGGELELAHLSNGAWLISRWEIRMPQGQIHTRVAMQHSQVRSQQQVTVESLRVAGGEVQDVVVGGERILLRSDGRGRR